MLSNRILGVGPSRCCSPSTMPPRMAESCLVEGGRKMEDDDSKRSSQQEHHASLSNGSQAVVGALLHSFPAARAGKGGKKKKQCQNIHNPRTERWCNTVQYSNFLIATHCHSHQNTRLEDHVFCGTLLALTHRSGIWTTRPSSQRISCLKIPFLFHATPSR